MELRHDMLAHGVNIVCAAHDGHRGGLAVAWATQVSVDHVLICVGAQSATRELILAISGHKALLELEPVTQNAVHLRNPYIDPLNYLQVEMLRQLRALPDPNGSEADSLREVVFLTPLMVRKAAWRRGNHDS